MTLFSDMALPAPLLREVQAKGYTTATAVQQLVSSAEHVGKDLLVSSRTGSGKTLAFGFAAASDLLDDKGKCQSSKMPLLLAIAPTRELALQVAKELSWLYRQTGARVVTCVGGMDARQEARTLQQGAQIVVGTPGRLCDHLDRGALVLTSLKTVVLDEADEMLDMGFRDELEHLLQAMPAERRTLLFSATLPKQIEMLAKRYSKDPIRLSASTTNQPHDDINTVVHLVASPERTHAIVNVLRAHDASSALVFCATREGCAHLAALLVERGFAATALSGDMSQAQRNRAIHDVRDGRVRILVATDVAARGLDLPDVGLVLHADLPHDAQVLQHRSGRTGRAGKQGTAVVLVPFHRRGFAERLVRDANVRSKPTAIPQVQEIADMDAKRLQQELHDALPALTAEDLAKGASLAAELGAEQVGALLWQRMQRALPSPEDMPLTNSLRSPGAPPRKVPPAKPAPVSSTTPAASPVPSSKAEAKAKVSSAAPPPAPAPIATPTAPNVVEPVSHQEPRAEPAESAPAPLPVKAPKAVRAPAAVMLDGEVWFSINIGAQQQADVRWLLPMICRRGGVSKQELGKFVILDRETRVAVHASVAERFAKAVQRVDNQDPGVVIEPASPPMRGRPMGRPMSRDNERGDRGDRERSPRGPRPEGDRPPFQRRGAPRDEAPSRGPPRGPPLRGSARGPAKPKAPAPARPAKPPRKG
jgi:ATP-dependent RNA helicase DeaD